MTPEQQARQQIDAQLIACGWVIQDYAQFNPAAVVGKFGGIALREVPLKSGRCDYLLLVDRKSLGIVEAKPEGTLLSGVSEQTAHYAVTTPAFFKVERDELPFLYESTGVETFFRNTLDPEPRSRHVFAFHKPETLLELASQADTLRARLAKMPVEHPLVKTSMRDCQIEANTNLEQSFAAAHPRALIQMATGAGIALLLSMTIWISALLNRPVFLRLAARQNIPLRECLATLGL